MIKNKILIIIAIFMFSCLPLTVLAAEKNFPAGSLIIPMDSFYQPEDDGGILEAYGLVFYLLKHMTEGEHDITVYWIINQEKTNIGGIDFVIEDLTLEVGGTAVKRYDHAGGTSNLTFNTGDSFQKISYSGAPIIVDGINAAEAKTIINQSKWSAVDVHEAQVPFKAPVYREMHGTPPMIALMNNKEDKTGSGNAAILESYLRLAGICTDVYDIVTPNEIRDGILTSEDGYDFLWVPHWEGYKAYSKDDDGNGRDDVEDIVIKIKEFLENGNGLLAECASIEVFEHSENGLFLSTKGFGHNEGTNDPDTIILNDVTTPNAQVADFIYEPEGGYLHNWRPYHSGDNYKLTPTPDVSGGNSEYRDTVIRFTIDDTGWDYCVGGYAYGNTNYGYVTYLGGHKYAGCSGSVEVDVEPNIHTLEFKFKKDTSDEEFTFLVKYDSGFETTVTCNALDDPLTAIAGDPLEIAFTTASVDKKELQDVTFRNNGASSITIDSITISWTNGDGDQKIKKITDKKTDDKLYDGPEVVSGAELVPPDFTTFNIEAGSGGESAGCTNNDDCSWNNIAGVRYILNTLFNIKFQISNHEYVRAAPIVAYPYLYQGSFEYPSYKGHFRRYNVTSDTGDPESADWDTADGHILDDDNRNIFTAAQDDVDGGWSKIEFAVENINNLRLLLDVTPENNDDTDEEAVIERVRGKDWNSNTAQWEDQGGNKLGGIEHSAPVIVDGNSRIGTNRIETAYVGDLYGMLHAIETETGDEKWAYVPNNLLGKLQNDRTDENAPQDFAAVDGSPSAVDIYYDPPNIEGTAKQWRTILVCPEGYGGKYIFALDITDPDDWSVLWELTDAEAPGGGMGHAYRVSLDKVKWPIKDPETEEIIGYETKWMLFVATGFAGIAEEHGGINIFAFNIQTGEKLWHFSQMYADSVNDIPGDVTLFDLDDDSFVDRVYVGDLNGRMWELDAVTGKNPNGFDESEGKEIPLWNAGVGNPVLVSPSITRINNSVIVVFGTGGADWAADDQSYYIYAVKATNKQETPSYESGAGTLYWEVELSVGEKVWSGPTIAGDNVYIATSTGTMETADPREDTSSGTGKLYAYKLEDGSQSWNEPLEIGKTRGSIFVNKNHAYMTTVANEIVQVGNGNFIQSSTNNVALRSWQQLN